MKDKEEFTPEIVDEVNGYGIVLISLYKCSFCNSWMLDEKNSYLHNGNNKIDKQLKRAGWKRKGELGMSTLGTLICNECVLNDVESFKCVLCKKKKNSSEIKRYIGYPAEYLCKDCYSTVAAEIWDKKVEELEENHRWDYE